MKKTLLFIMYFFIAFVSVLHAKEEHKVGKLQYTVPELIQKLEVETLRSKREFIIGDLGLSRDPRAVPILIDLVENGGIGEKELALRALSANPNPIAIPILKKALKGLGMLNIPEKDKGFPAEAFKFHSKIIRARAAGALIMVGEKEIAYRELESIILTDNIGVLDYLIDYEKRNKGEKEIVRDERAKLILIKALKSKNDDIKLSAAFWLSEEGYKSKDINNAINELWDKCKGDYSRQGKKIQHKIKSVLKAIGTKYSDSKLKEMEEYEREYKLKVGPYKEL